MSGAVSGTASTAYVQPTTNTTTAQTPAPANASAPLLPDPTTAPQTALADSTAMLYLLVARESDQNADEAKGSVQASRAQQAAAFQRQQEQIEKAKEAQEHKGVLGKIMDAIDSVSDAVVGGNPLQDIAKTLDDTLHVKAFEVAYDIVRPDAILHGAAMLAAAATGQDKITQAYDLGSSTSSLKTRFQTAADVTDTPEVMDAYAGLRDAIAGAMVTVGTCGTGTAAWVAIGMSAALTVESKLDLLGRAGIHGGVATAIRVGAQLYGVAAGASIGAVMKGAAQATSLAAKVTVNCIQGSKDITEGALKMGQAAYQYSADNHMASSEAELNTQNRAGRAVDRIVSGLKQTTQNYQQTLQTLNDTMDAQNQANVALARGIA